MKYILVLLLLFFEISCGLVPKDFSENPLSVRYDKMRDITWVSSKWSDHYGKKSNGYLKPYLGITKDGVVSRFKLRSIGSNAIFFNTVYVKCESKKTFKKQKKAFENWSKSFDTGCGPPDSILQSIDTPYVCKNYESADISLKYKEAKYILECKDNLAVRLSGQSRSIEFTYTKAKDPRYFQGLDDISKYVKKLEKENKKIL